MALAISMANQLTRVPPPRTRQRLGGAGAATEAKAA